jgi:hypothetical protein
VDQGGASLIDGQIELMMQRAMLKDDSRGVGEALNEQCAARCCAAIRRVAPNRYF